MSPTLHHLFKYSYTIESLERRVTLLRQVLETVFYDEAGPDRTTVIASVAEHVEDQRVLQALPEAVWQSYTPETITRAHTALEAEVAALPVLGLTVPVALSETQLARLTTWARTHIDRTLLFTVTVHSRAVGGCLFDYKGRSYNWSFQRRLAATPGLITRLLDSYAG